MNPFLKTLTNIDRGTLCDDLDDALSTLIGKVKERGKGGALTLTIKIKPLDSDAESVSVTTAVKVAEPPKSERPSIFFTTEENQLVRDNPAQAELPLRPVAKVQPDIQPVAKPEPATAVAS